MHRDFNILHSERSSLGQFPVIHTSSEFCVYLTGKLTRHVEYLKEELNSEQNAKSKAREEIRELQKALGQAAETRVRFAI